MIQTLSYLDWMKTILDKINGNFASLDRFGKDHPQSLRRALAWQLLPGHLATPTGALPTFSRTGKAYGFTGAGTLVEALDHGVRLVDGHFGSQSALLIEGAGATLFPDNVMADSNSDGLANGWAVVGGLPSELILALDPSGIEGLDQKVLIAESLVEKGIEYVTAYGSGHLNKRYMISCIARITRGTPTTFAAVVRAKNLGGTLIYEMKTPFTLQETLGSGYGVYVAEVITPDVIDFGNLPGQTGETVATVAIGTAVTSLTDTTVLIWHIQAEETKLSSPIRQVGGTRAAESLTYPFPTVTQRGTLDLYLKVEPFVTGASFMVWGNANELGLKVENGRLNLIHMSDQGLITLPSLAATDFSDGEFHRITIGWDNYVDEFGAQHTPLYYDIDGINQVVPLDLRAVLDIKTQRYCVDAYQEVAAENWVMPSVLRLWSAVDHPVFYDQVFNQADHALLLELNTPLGMGPSPAKRQETLRWNLQSPTTPQVEFDGTRKLSFTGRIISAKLVVGTNSGTNAEFTEADLKLNGVSLFSTKPSLEGDAGNYQSSSNEVLSNTLVTAGSVLTADLTDVSVGVGGVTVEMIVEATY